MIFLKPPTFSPLIADLLGDDESSKMQAELAKRPDVGDLIKNAGSIRKLLWKRAETGNYPIKSDYAIDLAESGLRRN